MRFAVVRRIRAKQHARAEFLIARRIGGIGLRSFEVKLRLALAALV
jgi:hypothetical protein